MAITLDEVFEMSTQFHHMVGVGKGDAAAHQAFFRYPDSLIFAPHAGDLTFEQNAAIHAGLTDEKLIHLEPWEFEQTCDKPERARATGNVYWEGRQVGGDGGLLKVIVGEDWLVERVGDGSLKFVFYINTHHLVLPDSAPFAL